jgi:undecaprenyl-diphosphatase
MWSFPVRLLLDRCAGGYSFISNHAANHFGMATFFFITMKPVFGKWAALSLCWAALIAYAQVYVGVHFPSDVLAGALIGTGLGWLTGKLFNKRYGFSIFDRQPTISP